ncbi:molybdate ABC transporter substrate-binding protein [Azohydromonas australica]|uniref:molybdate ABC transporter substrate-binding protein n=1 Tax=Azohydromonas australica TaxID=364039 RepID=UPI0003FB6968
MPERKTGTGALAALLLGLMGAGATGAARADEVLVAVAANFNAPLARIAQGFEARTGHKLKAAAASTGKLYAQIAAGAPFELLLSADDETPAKLEAEGRAVPGSRFTYAIGELVLWSAQPGLVDAQGAVLGSDRWKHLAIANPKTAPYGRAALEVLRARGLEAAAAPRLVTAESIAQAQQFTASGNAELGFLAWSQLSVPGQAPTGSWWRVPASLHEEIRQDAVLLKPGQNRPAAIALLAYLKTEPAKAEIRAWGYRVPGEAAAPAKPGKP